MTSSWLLLALVASFQIVTSESASVVTDEQKWSEMRKAMERLQDNQERIFNEYQQIAERLGN